MAAEQAADPVADLAPAGPAAADLAAADTGKFNSLKYFCKYNMHNQGRPIPAFVVLDKILSGLKNDENP